MKVYLDFFFSIRDLQQNLGDISQNIDGSQSGFYRHNTTLLPPPPQYHKLDAKQARRQLKYIQKTSGGASQLWGSCATWWDLCWRRFLQCAAGATVMTDNIGAQWSTLVPEREPLVPPHIT